MDVNNWPIDHSNDEELLSDLGDIQMKIIELRYRFKELALSLGMKSLWPLLIVL